MIDRLHTVRTLAAAVALIATVGALSACNTVAGAGKDVSAAGRATTNSANDVKNGN